MFLVHFYCPANLLTLNFSKTEFLLIGLKKQLTKITTLHLTPPILQCLKSWLHLWRTSYLLWPNHTSLQSLLSDLSTSLYPALPRFVNCLHNNATIRYYMSPRCPLEFAWYVQILSYRGQPRAHYSRTVLLPVFEFVFSSCAAIK